MSSANHKAFVEVARISHLSGAGITITQGKKTELFDTFQFLLWGWYWAGNKTRKYVEYQNSLLEMQP